MMVGYLADLLAMMMAEVLAGLMARLKAVVLETTSAEKME